MFQSLAKTSLFVTMFCLLSATNYLETFAQCNGVYPKTITRKILGEKTFFLDYYDEYYRDFTGDGKIDLIGFVANDVNTPTTKIDIFPGNGAGDFGTPIRTTLPTAIYARTEYLKIVDFNSDGKYDFITVTNQNPKTATIYRSNGGGTFTPLAPNILYDEHINGIVDVNGDGLLDLINSRGGATPEIFYRPANADGSFGTGISLMYADYAFAADFNGDGKTDFPVLQYQSGNYNLRIYNNTGNGTFVLGSNSFPIYFGVQPTYSVVSDFNNDGKPDLLFYAANSADFALLKVIVMMNQGNGSFTKTELNTPGAQIFSKALAKDFNGDGFQDIYLKTISGGLYSYSIYQNNGTGGFTRSDYNERDAGVPVGDLDGDNRADFVRFNTNDGVNPYPQIFTQTHLSVSKNVCSKVGQTRIVDFDGDGWNDTVFWRQSDGRWRVLGRKYPFQISTFYWGQLGDIPVPGDYDGDGKTDYAVFRPSNGAWYYVNSSNGSFAGVTFGTTDDKPVPADYNGDGRTDIAVYRPSNGIWYVLYGGTNQFYGAAFGAPEDKPVPEDYDGDGKTDFAVFRPSSGYWYVLKSSDTAFFAVSWGLETDARVPADYDGDGKADIAVMRSGSTNVWYIRRSNGAPSASYPSGTTGDTAQPSDWNGDEIWDTGVFRQSSGNWYSSYHPLGFASFAQTTGEIPISSLNVRY